MFNGNSSLTELDVSNWDTSNVTSMFFMFQNASQLTELDVSNWKTGNVTNINNMFNGVRRVTKLDVSNWDTSKVEGMQGVFQNTASLTEIDVSNWDTSKVKRTDYMFYNNLTGDWVSKLTTIDVSNWDTSNIEDMSSMFGGARNLVHLDVSNWDTSSVSSMRNLFEVTPKIEELDLSNWNTTNMDSSTSTNANAGGMFRGMNGLKRLHLGEKTTFLNLAENRRPTLPENVMPADLYTGNWIFEKDLEGNLSTEHLTLTPTNFFHEYDGSKTGTYVWEKKEAQPVTVRYEDVDGNPLSTETILNGTIGLPYETEAKEIPGWSLTETPSNAFGTFTAEPQEVIYVYDRSDAEPVTVKYEDTEGKQLSEPTILRGKVGLPYESEPKEIPGWYVPETPSNAHGIFGEEAQEVIFIYDRSDAAPVTVKYEDGEGNQLSEPTILSGKVGLPYESESKEIPGWYVPETPSNAHGIFSEEPQEVLYVYDRSDAAPVTVKYEDTEGNQLSEPTILSGKVGLPYESEPKEIPGWYVPETPTNAHGIFGKEAQEVVYVYDRSDAAPVTVKYEDTEGNQLSEPTILSGKVGLPYESEPKEIPGWYVPETPSNARGIFSEDPQEVIYVYDRSDAAPVTVKYEDTEGNQLSEPTILSGKVGLPYESKPKEIPGWYVPEMPSNVSGTFTEEAQEVIYIYDRSDAAPVTVKYEDTEGNQLSEPTILSGKVGLPYESKPKEISGWTVKEIPDNASGTFTNDVQEVIYVYHKEENNGGQNTPEKENPENEKEDSNDPKLPNTGEAMVGQRIMIIVGSLLLLFAIFIIFDKKKKTR
jgi:surface protein